MKKKLLASLLVGSAVVGASLAPLSAQATTTGTTPVTVGIEGGTLPDGDGPTPNTVRPDPDAKNNNFDLLFIPSGFNFGKLSITDDLTKPIPNKTDAGLHGYREAIGVGDLRGTKEGWHLTAQSNGMTLGNEKLQGNIVVGSMNRYDLAYDEVSKKYNYLTVDVSAPTTRPEMPTSINWTLDLGGDAKLLANATTGKGQGLWQFSMLDTVLNLTTTANEIKAGNYTGTITWNLVAGPSTPAPAN
ncbi:WxL domain-containing protein [Enterococcus sp. DIV1444a]|uniref:WxL domain-containing protein n=1 Tax=Enterococcus sp. DIV1444a TaxID=2774679 RepID=UPI003F21BEC1